MIIMGNPRFAAGMKLAGVKDSFVIRDREEGIKKVETMDLREFILANVSVIEMLPELEEFPNLVSIPDNVEELSSTSDLKRIIKSAVGMDIEL
mgnify:CR=1 FL=1